MDSIHISVATPATAEDRMAAVKAVLPHIRPFGYGLREAKMLIFDGIKITVSEAALIEIEAALRGLAAVSNTMEGN